MLGVLMFWRSGPDVWSFRPM